MPPRCRYMTQATGLLEKHLFKGGKYILDKTLAGCGGTTLFLSSPYPIVLVSPRSNMLKDKHNQLPFCYLFRNQNDNEKVLQLKADLWKYLDNCSNPPFGTAQYPKVLVTVDSAKYVLEVLEGRGEIDNYIFVVDEFQNLVSDSSFKGPTDYQFLFTLDSKAKNICYLSATPIEMQYLQNLSQFKSLDYYKLEWDSSVVVEPTLHDICMRKGETPKSICLDIIRRFRQEGYFERKIVNGKEVRSFEGVFFINEVRTICDIIKSAGLLPNEVKILVSPSHDSVKILQGAGYKVNEVEGDKTDPNLRNKPFTFVTSSSFQGRDFYSLCASTYIFVDGNKSWQTLDTAIDIQQILGRQRLDANPFKYDATIYYKVKPNPIPLSKFKDTIIKSTKPCEFLVKSFKMSTDKEDKESCFEIAKNLQEDRNFIAIIDMGAGKGFDLEINYLKIAALYNLWNLNNYYYNNPISLIRQIENVTNSRYGTKPEELRFFEGRFHAAKDFQQKMREYCLFMEQYSQYQELVFNNPFIDFKFHEAFYKLGAERLRQLDYDENAIAFELCYKPQIVRECEAVFMRGNQYPTSVVKNELQKIYDKLGLAMKAKANEIENYIDCKPTRPRFQGAQVSMYQIM